MNLLIYAPAYERVRGRMPGGVTPLLLHPDGSLTLNLAAFYYDYKDYQISEIVERSAFNRNFDATVWGIEIESDWRPLENLKLGFKGGYEKTRIADGEKAIDLMDRTAGDPNWLLVRPFPTQASSCTQRGGTYRAEPSGKHLPARRAGWR